MVQTHTVWFERPFLLWLGTLLPDYTILGKMDSRSRNPKPESEAGLTRNWAISQFVSKYTVLFLEPIRSLLDPSRVSHTIIGTSDSSRLTSEAGLPKPDSLRIGLSPNSSPNTRSYSLDQSVHYWIFSGVPHYYWDVGRPGRVSGPIPTTASLSRTGWPVGPPASYQSN